MHIDLRPFLISCTAVVHPTRESAGFRGLKLSAGHTPGLTLAEHLIGVDEVRPGNLVYYYLIQSALGCMDQRAHMNKKLRFRRFLGKPHGLVLKVWFQLCTLLYQEYYRSKKPPEWKNQTDDSGKLD